MKKNVMTIVYQGKFVFISKNNAKVFTRKKKRFIDCLKNEIMFSLMVIIRSYHWLIDSSQHSLEVSYVMFAK